MTAFTRRCAEECTLDDHDCVRTTITHATQLIAIMTSFDSQENAMTNAMGPGPLSNKLSTLTTLP